jgi:hypothetical protein
METSPPHENIVYQGRILEIVQKEVGGKIFEIARRSPGVRLIILKDESILLTKERRHEYNGYDYRLP